MQAVASPTSPAPEVKIFTLGEVFVELDARPVPKLTKPTKALLVYLALTPDRVHARETLAQLLWLAAADEGDSREEKRAQDSLRKALQTLGEALGDDLILKDPDNHTLQWNPARKVRLDAREAEAAGRLYLASPRAEESPLPLFRGEFMAGYDDLPAPAWIERERARLTELESQVRIADARRARGRGNYAHALEQAERVLGREPANQDACAEAMWCHWRLNQPREALRAYDALKAALKEQNEIPLTALRNLRGRIMSDIERTTRRALELTNLPVSETSFIGRARELQELRALLRPREGRPKRLVTLVGSGGSGKTRLARELADRVLKQYRDGVWWIELDALEKETGGASAEENVAQAIAHALGVRHETERALVDTLAAHLREKKLLLALDNCEHVMRGCETVCAKLLASCPRLQIVATSREGLRVSGEKVFALSPLAIPHVQDAKSLQTLAQNEAVRLFTDRAREEQEKFALNQDNARDVAQLCRRLDGLPLALELAAARMNTLTLREIVEGLDERFEVLKRGKRVPARHETLRAVMDWSYDLLTPEERELFALVGVFAGRFTEEAVEKIRTEGKGLRTESESGAQSSMLSTVDLLSSLVDKSLALREFDEEGGRRYRLLETLRAYARERLDEDAERADAAYVRMARYYLEFAKTHQEDFIGLEREWDNLSYGLSISHWQENWQEALDYGYALTDAAFARGLYTQARAMYPLVMEAAGRLEEQGADIQMRLNYARALIEQGFYPEAREVLEQLQRISEMAADEHGIAGAQTLLGRVEFETGNFEKSEKLLQIAQSIWQALGNQKGLGETLTGLAWIRYYSRDYDQALALARLALGLMSAKEDVIERITLWRILANCAYIQEDYQTAIEYCNEGLMLCQGDKYLGERASNLYMLSQIYWKRGELEEARSSGQEALMGFRHIGDRKTEAYALNHLAFIYLDLGENANALESVRNGEQILGDLGDEWATIYLWRALGKVYRATGKKRRAREIWSRALEKIDSEFPDHPMKGKILELLAKG